MGAAGNTDSVQRSGHSGPAAEQAFGQIGQRHQRCEAQALSCGGVREGDSAAHQGFLLEMMAVVVVVVVAWCVDGGADVAEQ